MYKFEKDICLLTETLPGELPLIYTNQKLHRYMKSYKKDLLDYDFDEKKSAIYTVPFNYYIKKNERENRKISLLHPIAQLQVSNVLIKYDHLILNYIKNNSVYSIRKPFKLNDKYIKIEDKYKQEIKWLTDGRVEYVEEEQEELVKSYFIVKDFKRITDFYKSNYLKQLELKYKNLIRIDYANCFDSMYTHSLEWAYVGNKNIVKDDLNGNRFSTKLDKLAQRINYNETNGIVVGPEISRVLAEIILTRIDKNVYYQLNEEHIFFKKDYEVVRFIDDIMIFYNDKEIGDKVKDTIELKSSEYKLKINSSKTKYEKRPFFREHMWIPQLKRGLHLLSEFYKQDTIEHKYYIYNKFSEEFKEILCEFEENTRYIVSYCISAMEGEINKIINRLEVCNNKDRIKYHYMKLVDILIYIINYYASYENIIKLCRIIYKIQKSSECSNIDLNDFLFKKLSTLLYYNEDNFSSLSNIIIVLSDNNNFLSESYLLKILSNNKDYFTISIITYYIRKKNSEYYSYQTTIREINNIVSKNLDDIEIRYGTINSNNVFKVICSEYFYLLHDIYSSNILQEPVIKRINDIKKSVNTRFNQIETMTLEKLFLNYIKDFDKPFINWSISKDDIITGLIINKCKRKNIYL